MKKPAHNFTSIPFPDCAKDCSTVEYLGCGECDYVCPWKFDKNGNEITILNTKEAS